jgi:hypothetical protein
VAAISREGRNVRPRACMHVPIARRVIPAAGGSSGLCSTLNTAPAAGSALYAVRKPRSPETTTTTRRIAGKEVGA